MHRPIGITILALLAGLAGLFEIWRALVFLGVVSFEFIGKPVAFDEAQWGPAFWAVVLALIWFWVAAGLWNVRAYAWQFGNFIAIFTVIFGFFAILGGSTTSAARSPGWAGHGWPRWPTSASATRRCTRARCSADGSGSRCASPASVPAR